jgi:hypothetical protein
MSNKIKAITVILIIVGLAFYGFAFMFCTPCGDSNYLTKYIFTGASLVNSNSEFLEVYFVWLVIPGYSILVNICIIILLKRLKKLHFLYYLSISYLLISGLMILGIIKVIFSAQILQGYHN